MVSDKVEIFHIHTAFLVFFHASDICWAAWRFLFPFHPREAKVPNPCAKRDVFTCHGLLLIDNNYTYYIKPIICHGLTTKCYIIEDN